MSKWQHFLHAFGVHDWHKTGEYTVRWRDPAHGTHAPVPLNETRMIELQCCHCGKQTAMTWWEALGKWRS